MWKTMNSFKYYLLLYSWIFFTIVSCDINYFSVLLPFSISYYLFILILVTIILMIIDAVRQREADEENLFVDK